MNRELLEQLVALAGVPGREHRIRQFLLAACEPLFDSVSVDPLGSVIAVRQPRPAGKDEGHPARRVMLAAHMDQIGFLVNHIDDKGYLRIQPVGGFDTRNLFARLVTISPDLGDPGRDLTGVLNPAGKPVHLSTPEERNKVPEIQDFYVDTGLSVEEVRKQVRIGDMVTLRASVAYLGNNIVSQCLDNRVACWIALEAIRQLEHHHAEIHCVFTVQEEVGLRGAMASAQRVMPEIGIAIDTTLACDTPGIPTEQATSRLGQGATLSLMDASAIADLEIVHHFEKIAQERSITTQRSVMSRGGTDSGGMQRNNGGVRTMTLSVPTRYIHTVTEMVSLDDLAGCRDLLAGFLAQV